MCEKSEKSPVLNVTFSKRRSKVAITLNADVDSFSYKNVGYYNTGLQTDDGQYIYLRFELASKLKTIEHLNLSPKYVLQKQTTLNRIWLPFILKADIFEGILTKRPDVIFVDRGTPTVL
ncbi:hypothetical protein Q7X32_00290 [Glaesserella parasuis]|uniref:hypothetical protein n=1 Tax=Glaesserella parasuis TaxID=738 RepID=UPI00094F574D|nr:hypothetical protein [Glaesserella parasuis]MCT8824697.1 hypothetical protein [Glaesserella parasuis]MDP0375887.1 hypothetical protein [Glaesserella parasuis]